MFNIFHFSQPNLTVVKTELSPFYISGLIQADGSFFVGLGFSKSFRASQSKGSTPLILSASDILFSPTLTLTLLATPANSNLLKGCPRRPLRPVRAILSINAFFNNCGYLVNNPAKSAIEWRVTSIKNLKTYIFPHFLNYPLFGLKYRAFSYLFYIISQKLPQGFGKSFKGMSPTSLEARQGHIEQLESKKTLSPSLLINLVGLILCLNQQTNPLIESSEELEPIPDRLTLPEAVKGFPKGDPF
jgi:hypothetical protein